MQIGSPNLGKQMADIARQVASRWQVSLPDDPRDIHQSVKIALRDAADNAGAANFSVSHPDDHAWMTAGLRGLTRSRLVDDEQPTGLSAAAAEWGIVAVVSGYGSAIVIPLLADLDPDAARGILGLLEGEEETYLDLECAPSLLAAAGVDPEADEIEVQMVAASWFELRDLAQSASILPLSKAMMLRRPVMFDLLRARVSGLPAADLPAFDHAQFERRRNLAVRHDDRSMDAAREFLSVLRGQNPDLETPSGVRWFKMMADHLAMLGEPMPLDGLTVIVCCQVKEIVDEGKPAGLPADLYSWRPAGVRNVCIGYGLDPLQATLLFDQVARDPVAFVDFADEEDGLRFEIIEALVVHDSYLARLDASLAGRDPAAYDAVRSEAAALGA